MRISTRKFTGLHSPIVLLAGLLLGTAVLAYGFGLRHAVDADHIAAIDNVTRKLMHEGQRLVTAGLYFSLGHSTIVGALTVLTVLGTGMMRHHLGHLKIIGGVIGTSVPTLFLLAIAAVNVTVLADTWRHLHEVSSGAQTAGVLDTPVRKLHYNLSITTLSVGVAVIVGVSRRSDSSAGICSQPARSVSSPTRSPAIPLRSGPVSPQCFCSAGWSRSRSTDSGGTRPHDVMSREPAGAPKRARRMVISANGRGRRSAACVERGAPALSVDRVAGKIWQPA